MKDKVLGYIRETVAEVKKVVWPDRRYITVATLIILVLVFLTGFFVMFVDYILAAVFKFILR